MKTSRHLNAYFFLGVAFVGVTLAPVVLETSNAIGESALVVVTPPPVELNEGPYLFIDDYWIGEANGLTRVLNRPWREPNPVVTSGRFGVSQPFLSVLPDVAGFRMYYIAPPTVPDSEWYGPNLMVAWSDDGKSWLSQSKHLIAMEDLTYGTDVLDSGVPGPERYRLVYTAVKRQRPQEGDMMLIRIAFSDDGIHWTRYDPIDTLLPGRDRSSEDNWGDIPIGGYDPLHDRYWFAFRMFDRYQCTNAEGVSQNRVVRRTGIMFSDDFKTWTTPQVLFAPDEKDSGVTEFYGGPTGVQARGDLLIGFLKILRDDITVSGAPPGAYGMGYTVLTWSRDGETWYRDRTPFFEPNPKVGAWDHAHAWIDESRLMDETLYLYYGGYKWGHKYNPESERQIGLAYLRRDRYVARYADLGTLKTPLVLWQPGARLTVNADVKGSLNVRLEDDEGATVMDCLPLGSGAGDATSWVPLECPGIETVKGEVRLVFDINRAYLFGFDLEPGVPVDGTPTSTATISPTPYASATPPATVTSTTTLTPSATPTSTATPTPLKSEHGVFMPLFLR